MPKDGKYTYEAPHAMGSALIYNAGRGDQAFMATQDRDFLQRMSAAATPTPSP